ncbi:Nucleotidyl transferase (plasmid) [Methanohalobium evestigatum Z-7303]|uniref:Bifunctional protein GlmU n=1 Tax=Methanohalobium evestigatum (strain ATCC BAA-1072 / DSM 3721 / NBRC 107634 / OCM 161 / Z-7303) TaxID=644295 RepID=D7EBX3_METEZ|nr:bifunctional sugar-1-phosphate nucleotidylyltransferase/acetyltransferase [Methanohalobium evestigatum]ADI75095.1 Nucleotidyl transferase [Methanohalobium evestigatum Z-7303]
MKAVILAAGEGSRCRPLTLTKSKVMLPVANKPVLEHIIESLEKCSITDIILIVDYEKERIMDHFEDGKDFGVNITYIHQSAQLGTAHALLQTQEHVKDENQFLVLNGDNVVEPETISDLIEDAEGDASVLTQKMKNTSNYGVVITDNKKIEKIVEKPEEKISNLVNTGIYLFTPNIFQIIKQTPISEKGEYAITDTLQLMIDYGYQVTNVNTKSRWIDAIFAWDLLTANSIVLGEYEDFKRKGDIEDGAVIKGDVEIGENTTIRSGCYIIGPVIIGDNCEIGPNAVILPSTTIGHNSSVESFTHLQNAIVMNDTRISTHSYLSNSVIGNNNTIGTHFITEEKDSLKIEIKGMLHKADRLGTIIGDDNLIRDNVLVKAGTLIGTDCRVESGNVVQERLEKSSIVI